MRGFGSNGEKQKLSLLVTFAQDGFDPVDALAQLAGHVRLRRLLEVLDQGALARGDAVPQVVDKDGRTPPSLGRGEGKQVVRRNRDHGL